MVFLLVDFGDKTQAKEMGSRLIVRRGKLVLVYA